MKYFDGYKIYTGKSIHKTIIGLLIIAIVLSVFEFFFLGQLNFEKVKMLFLYMYIIYYSIVIISINNYTYLHSFGREMCFFISIPDNYINYKKQYFGCYMTVIFEVFISIALLYLAAFCKGIEIDNIGYSITFDCIYMLFCISFTPFFGKIKNLKLLIPTLLLFFCSLCILGSFMNITKNVYFLTVCIMVLPFVIYYSNSNWLKCMKKRFERDECTQRKNIFTEIKLLFLGTISNKMLPVIIFSYLIMTVLYTLAFIFNIINEKNNISLIVYPWYSFLVCFLTTLIIGRGMPIIKVTFPSAKKMFTKELCLFIQAVSLIILAIVLTIVMFFTHKGLSVDKAKGFMFIFMSIQFLTNLAAPFMSKTVSSLSSSDAIISANSFFTVFKLILFFQIVVIPTWLMYHFFRNIVSFVTLFPTWIFLLMYYFVFLLGGVINYLLYLHNYKNR